MRRAFADFMLFAVFSWHEAMVWDDGFGRLRRPA
jgi:hypothetical protein